MNRIDPAEVSFEKILYRSGRRARGEKLDVVISAVGVDNNKLLRALCVLRG